MAAAQPLVVVLRPLGLGDFLTGVPAFRAIARAFPRHRIVLAAPAALAPLTELAGGIDALHPTQPLAALDEALHGADVAIDLHGRGPASHRIVLAARPGRLIAFAHAEIPASAGGAVWRPHEHEVQRWCRMLDHAGIQADPADLDLRIPGEPISAGLRGATIVHASAAAQSRRWPLARWVAFVRALRANGERVVLTGGSADVARVSAIADRSGVPADAVLAGRTDLRRLAAIVAAARRVVCGDTGVAHLATAYRIPSVVLFGPIAPALWGPPPDRPYHRALWSGRSGDPHAGRIDPGLLEISVTDALDAFDALERSVVPDSRLSHDRRQRRMTSVS